MTTIPARAKPAWPWRAEVLVLLAATLLAGCATAPREAHVGDTARLDPQAELGESGVSGASNATGIENSVLKWNILGDAETRPAFWPSYPRPQVQFASLDAASSAGPALSTTESEPSIFSKDYCKTLGLEVKETVVAPAHWEGRDWLLLSGVTAGIVAVGVFDEDIQRAVQRNRNHTTDDIFNAVEPFGQGYSYAVLGAF